jgi:hypothetical protein
MKSNHSSALPTVDDHTTRRRMAGSIVICVISPPLGNGHDQSRAPSRACDENVQD